MKVADWMTTKVETIQPRDTLEEAEAMMQRGRFRCLPIVDDGGALVGILTHRDLGQHRPHLASTRVTAAMVENPVIIGPDDSIERAAEIILTRKIGGLPVMSEGTLVGLLTDNDLLADL